MKFLLPLLLLLLICNWNISAVHVAFKVLSNNNYDCWNETSLPCATNRNKMIPGMTKQDFIHSRGDFVDYKRKIMMSWTAKAGCTVATMMFLAHVGFHEGIDWQGWVHDFRKTYYHRCGYFGSCIFNHPEFYKFKVVRNPYDRAVSTYIHIMRTRLVNDEKLLHHAPHVKHRKELSFKHFLTYLENHLNTPMEQEFDAGGHAIKQSYDFEFLQWLTTGKYIYNRIVKLENFQNDINLINIEANTSFHTNFTSDHYVNRSSHDRLYIGNQPFHKIENKIPKDFGNFYDEEDQIRVSRLFFTDLLLYNYSYPYDNFKCDKELEERFIIERLIEEKLLYPQQQQQGEQQQQQLEQMEQQQQQQQQQQQIVSTMVEQEDELKEEVQLQVSPAEGLQPEQRKE